MAQVVCAEEDIMSTMWGIKGKIDATVRAQVHFPKDSISAPYSCLWSSKTGVHTCRTGRNLVFMPLHVPIALSGWSCSLSNMGLISMLESPPLVWGLLLYIRKQQRAEDPRFSMEIVQSSRYALIDIIKARNELARLLSKKKNLERRTRVLLQLSTEKDRPPVQA